jgi:hypothetical protein
VDGPPARPGRGDGGHSLPLVLPGVSGIPEFYGMPAAMRRGRAGELLVYGFDLLTAGTALAVVGLQGRMKGSLPGVNGAIIRSGMTFVRLLYFAVCVVVLATTAVFSQQSPPNAREAPKEQAQPKANSKQTISEQKAPSPPHPPINVNLQLPPKTETELAEQRREHDEKAELDRQLNLFTVGLYHATVWLACLTGALVLATCALGYFSWRQSRDMQHAINAAEQSANAARDSANIADLALRTTQRAYIAINPAGVAPFAQRWVQGGAADLVGHVIIKNVGTLPARDVRWSVKVDCTDDAQWVPPEPANFVGRNVVPPGTEMGHGSDKISSSNITALKREEGSGYCYVWGRVTYDDGFGQARFTDFCHRYSCAAFNENTMSIAAAEARFHLHRNAAD